MLRAKGNIWDYYDNGYYIVIPTNIGWKKNGCNVMGAGLAKQASLKFPDLSLRYGKVCQQYKEETAVIIINGLLLFPVKPLAENPSMSWSQPANLNLIEKSTQQLETFTRTYQKKIALPLVGCGNGRMDKDKVISILEKYLDDNFTLIDYK